MRLLTLLLLLSSVLFVSCDHNPNHRSGMEEQSGHDKHEYKRYTGTIAGLPVIVNLFIKTTTDSQITISGNYYYKGKSQIIDFYEKEERTNGELHFSEAAETTNYDDEEIVLAEWSVRMEKDKITGTWLSADRKITHPINLSLNYDGAYTFMFINGTDSITIKNNNGTNYKMESNYQLMVPSANMPIADAIFIEKCFGHELGGDSMKAENIYDFIKAKNKRDFKDYLGIMGETMNDEDEDETASNNWITTIRNTCRYNDKGMLVFEVDELSYTGGAHEIFLDKYICIDMKDRKVLHLADIMTVDTMQLVSVLDSQIRKSYDVPFGTPLSEKFLVDTLPVSNNIALSDVGIIFYYNTYEIGPYFMGTISVFVPYASISTMLLPRFCERMNIAYLVPQSADNSDSTGNLKKEPAN